MIDDVQQLAVHALFSPMANVRYVVPPYQREYSWQKSQWEDLLQDLLESEGTHFLGTIITLSRTKNVFDPVVEVIDGQQRMTTLTLLMSAIHSILKEADDLDDRQRNKLMTLGDEIVIEGTGQPRLTLQTQGNNRADFVTTLHEASLDIAKDWRPYRTMRRISKAYNFFRASLIALAEEQDRSPQSVAWEVLNDVHNAILVQIQVSTASDAFVLFESLNNRGLPLSPVDLVKNHFLAEAERTGALSVDAAFKQWSQMLTNLGDSYATHERFLRHFYNAFRAELPSVANASVATKKNLIRIYESILEADLVHQSENLIEASAIYGRISNIATRDDSDPLDTSLDRLNRAQAAPSYMLVMWLMIKRDQLELDDAHLIELIDLLTSFFVRRNLTGFPQTYGLSRLFMGLIADLGDGRGDAVVEQTRAVLVANSSSDDEFRARLEGRVYEENVEVTRFILATLSEDEMTRETQTDLWKWQGGRYVWTIEHILPQGANLPDGWVDMLGGPDAARAAQESHAHQLGNLTLTMYNSNLSNKPFAEKRDRTDSAGRHIGYRNGIPLNRDLAERMDWSTDAIQERTQQLVEATLKRFRLD